MQPATAGAARLTCQEKLPATPMSMVVSAAVVSSSGGRPPRPRPHPQGLSLKDMLLSQHLLKVVVLSQARGICTLLQQHLCNVETSTVRCAAERDALT